MGIAANSAEKASPLGEQAAGRTPVDIEYRHDPAQPDVARARDRGHPPPGRSLAAQAPRSSNRTGWMSSARTRRGGTTNEPNLTAPDEPSSAELELWKCPDRAQPPIVAGVKCMFYAAEPPSAASASVIQSDGAAIPGQSVRLLDAVAGASDFRLGAASGDAPGDSVFFGGASASRAGFCHRRLRAHPCPRRPRSRRRTRWRRPGGVRRRRPDRGGPAPPSSAQPDPR